MNSIIETTQTFHTLSHTTFIITHKGFRRIVQIGLGNEKLKDETTYYLNHQIGCVCLND